MAFADYTSHGAVAVITLNNPPVNALSLNVRKALADGLERAANDSSVGAVIIISVLVDQTQRQFLGGRQVE